VLQARERAPTPFPSIVFTFGLAIKSIKELRDASTLDQGRSNCGPIQMATKFWLFDIRPCLDGKLDLIQLASDFGCHVDRGLRPIISYDLGNLDRKPMNIGSIHMVAKFQSLDLGSYLDGEFDLDYIISNFNH
jgi:hypothetical protein